MFPPMWGPLTLIPPAASGDRRHGDPICDAVGRHVLARVDSFEDCDAVVLLGRLDARFIRAASRGSCGCQAHCPVAMFDGRQPCDVHHPHLDNGLGQQRDSAHARLIHGLD